LLAFISEVREELAAGRLVQVVQVLTPPIAPLALYYPSRRNPSAAFKALISFGAQVRGRCLIGERLFPEEAAACTFATERRELVEYSRSGFHLFGRKTVLEEYRRQAPDLLQKAISTLIIA